MINIKTVKEVIDSLPFSVDFTAEEWAENPVIENYHRHSDYSNGCVTDSVESQENYAKRTVEYGAKCLFTTEHGTQGDQFLTYKLCEKYGLKYRHGAEAYFVLNRKEMEYTDPDTGKKKTVRDRCNRHIVLIAKNAEGRREINYILSVANLDGYYYQPRIDLDLLLSMNPENVFVTSACVAGWKPFSEKDEEKLSNVFFQNVPYYMYPIESFWKQVADHFGKNFFFEVQAHKAPVQKELNSRLIELSQEWGVPLIAGLDSHYVLEENRDKRLQYQKDKNIEFDHEEDDSFYMDYPDGLELYRRFKEQGILSDKQIIEAMMNTLIFQSELMEDIVLDRSFKIPNLYKNLTYEQRTEKLRQILRKAYVEQGDLKRNKEKGINQEVGKGINWEIEQFVESNTVDYPLFSTELVSRAVNKFDGILTTTSRGSAASFITNKLLGFTTVDRYRAEIPIHPERFLTKDRILAGSLPDIDFNCATQKPFIDAARDLLGEHGAYPLMTLGKLKEKKAWAMYARINNIEPQKSLAVSKAIDKFNKAKLHAEEDEKDLVLIDDYIPDEYMDLYIKSQEYQGITDLFGTHACGCLCLDGDIRREIGLISAKSQTTGKRTLCAAIEGKYLDEFGYLKQDFLIVDTVLLTYKHFKSIGRSVPTFEELKELVKDDPKTWEIYSKGITVCVNQCEKTETTQKLMKYRPKSIGELSAFVAAIRPGFKSLVGTFINRESYSTGEPEIDHILAESQNFMLYQESIMAILNFLGVEMGETYQIIKSISKKKLKGKMKDDLLEKLKQGWTKRFGNLNNFFKVWNVIEDAAAYAFNSPHSYSMAGDSLYSAWFKAHYPDQFYKVSIDHYQEKNNKDKMNALVSEAIQHFGYRMGGYEFGADNTKTNIDEKNKLIYPPLTNIKGFGEKTAQDLLRLSSAFKSDYYRGEIDDRSFWQLLKYFDSYKWQTKINSTQLEQLIKIDYFHKFGSIEKLLEEKRLYDFYKKVNTRVSKKTLEQMGLNVNRAVPFGRETSSMIMDFQKDDYFDWLISEIPEQTTSLLKKIHYQIEIFGSSNIVDENFYKNLVFVLSISPKNKYGYMKVYNPRTGNTVDVKYWISQLERQKIKVGDCISLKVDKKAVKAWNGKLDKKGKKIYEQVPDQWEYWVKDAGKVSLL